ncbi:MAG: histidine phosphatase family protein [Candidatus Gottesmanbacteria bacterium]|nr:histidine phosphatase family protein [Candidatus Gottesmanbacteria bacterium]
MITTVYLVRHGAYENPKQILHGRLSGFPLSQVGKQMAVRLANYLARTPIVAVYSSRLTRAYQTAEIIAKKFHTKVIIDRRLLDIRTPLQGKPKAFIDKIDSDFYQPKYIRAGGERLEDVHKRMDSFIRTKVRQLTGRAFVIVSHGDPIMSVATRYEGKPLPRKFSFHNWYVPQASGFKIEFNSTGKPIRITKLP